MSSKQFSHSQLNLSSHTRRENLSPSRQVTQLTQMLSQVEIAGFHRTLQQLSLDGTKDEAAKVAIFGMVHYALTSHCKDSLGKHGYSLVSNDKFKEEVMRDDMKFFNMLREAAKSPLNDQDLRALILYSGVWTNRSERITENPVPLIAQNEAVECSWNAKYVNLSPLHGLVSHISNQLDMERCYGRYCSILQSSGMGKSRLLDEFSKSFFLIPINLRAEGTTGYPPPDDDVRNFFVRGSPIQAYQVRSFLSALFETTAETLRRLGDDQSTYYTQVARFREFMSKGQHMKSVGSNRRNFYQDVISRVLAKSPKNPDDRELSNKLEDLRSALKTDSQPEGLSKNRQYPNPGICAKSSSDIYVDVFIAFDEAHTLVRPSTEGETPFVVLRRVLSSITSFPIYSIFLSTTGNITQFTLPRGKDRSNRISSGILSTPSPYIYLGFDQLMQDRKVFAKWNDLDEVTSLDCAAHMGRPLWGARFDWGDNDVRRSLLEFAQEKLLCQCVASVEKFTPAQIYAVLSQRLALDTTMTKYLLCNENPLKAVDAMHEQIANHMRVAVTIKDGVETLRGIAPSEPILAEAAACIMSNRKFSLLEALSSVVSEYCIDKKDRGELIVASVFAWARDQAISPKKVVRELQLCPYFSVPELFQRLLSDADFKLLLDDIPSICPQGHRKLKFSTAFIGTKMHFNHLIKQQDKDTLPPLYLLHLIARGAAALGANCRPPLHAVYPFLHSGVALKVGDVGIVMVQVQTDSDPDNDHAVNAMFGQMDPMSYELMNSKNSHIPIIRIIFFLPGNDSPYFRKHKTLWARPKDRPSADFTSYDYVCSGVNGLGPKGQFSEWGQLLDDPVGWSSFYDIEEVLDISRSQLPACSSNKSHFASWSGNPSPWP